MYVQTDAAGAILRIGKASEGLEPRYRGGTGYALDAAMHSSGNLVFVASVPANLVDLVEAILIYEYQPMYNNVGKATGPSAKILLEHTGEAPQGLTEERPTL